MNSTLRPDPYSRVVVGTLAVGAVVAGDAHARAGAGWNPRADTGAVRRLRTGLEPAQQYARLVDG